jgi:protocatechuate 3,4-dioxygenase beta subunit
MQRKHFIKRLVHTATSIPLLLEACKKESSTSITSYGTTACGDPITPPVGEGPYYVNENLNRMDITEGKPGIPLTLIFKVEDINCQPISGAIVDIWHCDAGGVYSDESSQSTLGQKWLRGLLQTDTNGKCTFKTIFPGWYNGRLTHIHGKVKVGSVTKQTTNFFLPKAAEQAVYSTAAYASKGQNPTTVAQDVELKGNNTIYNSLMMAITGDIVTGYIANFTIAYS